MRDPTARGRQVDAMRHQLGHPPAQLATRLATLWQARDMSSQPATESTSNGHKIQLYTYSIDDLHFDMENPRLPEAVDGADDAQVLRWMLLDGSLLDLMGSIAEHGFFPGEPVLLVPRTAGGFTVVEGNRRLAAMRLLLYPDQAPVRATAVFELSEQAAGLQKGVSGVLFESRDEIIDYLGFRHITGIKEWEPLAKARYLKQLWERTPGDNAERLRILARKIGSQPYYVKRLLGGLRIFDTIERSDFYNIEGLDEGSLSFSLLSTAISFDSIVNYLGVPEDSQGQESLNSENVEKFTRWVFEKQPGGGGTVLGDSRNMTALASVVAKPESLSLLEQGASLTDAVLASEHMGQQFTRALRISRDRLETAQKLLRRVSEPNDADSDLLNDIIEAAGDLLAAVRRRIGRHGRG
jgi:hypothetical protein